MNNIAVMMAVYKNDKLDFVKKAIKSLYLQTFKQFDIYIQLDGKVQLEIEEYLEGEYKKRKIFYFSKRSEHKGISHSLNELLKVILKKEYMYIARMDADDICCKGRFELQYSFMQENIKYDVCGGFIEEFNTNQNKYKVIRYPQEHCEILDNLKKRNPIANVTTFIRRDFFYKVGFYDESKVIEDLDMWVRALKKGMKFYNLQEVLVKVRVDGDFYNRRKDIRKAIEILNLKLDSIKYFRFGYTSYIYAFGHFFLYLMPTKIKTFLYDKLR